MEYNERFVKGTEANSSVIEGMSIEEIEAHILNIIDGVLPTDEHERTILKSVLEDTHNWGHFTMIFDRGTHFELEIQFKDLGQSFHIDIRPNSDNTKYELVDTHWLELHRRAEHGFYANGGAKGHRIDY